MAFNDNPGRVEYTATAGQSLYSFLYKIYDVTDIEVYINNALTTAYTVSIDGDNGGIVTLDSPLAGGEDVVILRNLPQSRSYNYENNGDLRASTLNEDQNYQTYLIMDNGGAFYKNTPGLSGISTTMPTPSAGTVLKWNSTGTGIENGDPSLGSSGGSGGQYLGAADIKAVSYLSQNTSENLILGSDVVSLNGFSIDSLTIADGGSLTISNGSVFKVL